MEHITEHATARVKLALRSQNRPNRMQAIFKKCSQEDHIKILLIFNESLKICTKVSKVNAVKRLAVRHLQLVDNQQTVQGPTKHMDQKKASEVGNYRLAHI